DPDTTLEEQPSVRPGGVRLTVTGVADDGRAVLNRLTWTYTDECDVEPIRAGSEIGWVEFVSVEPALDAFCRAKTD
ncbi:hypothetical protein ACHAWF_002176, partial [Thalassiosira exigua]